MVEGWDVRFLPLPSRGFVGDYARLDLPALFLVRKNYRGYSLHISGRAPGDLATVILPVKTGRSFQFQGRKVSDADLILVDRQEDIDLAIDGGIHAIVAYLPEETRLTVLRGSEPGAEYLSKPIRIVGGPEVALLKTMLGALFGPDPEAQIPDLRSPGLSGRLKDLLVAAVYGQDQDLPPWQPGSIERKARHARCARDIIEEKRHEPLTLTDLGIQVGVSVRTLQYAFQDHFGISPGRYHLLRRLAGAHTELKQADPAEVSVTQVATHWGFFHLGRFSRAYGSHFGELPSRTLSRRETRLFQGQRTPATRRAPRRPPVPDPETPRKASS